MNPTEDGQNVGINVDELSEILSNYFYTKDEQKENSSFQNDVSSSQFDLVMNKLDILNANIETSNTLIYIGGIVMLAVLIWFIYYRFIKQFTERWY